MTENRIGFLYNIASCLSQSDHNEKLELLRSFYLMKCKEITGGLGLPTKQFSSAARCPRCCIDWNNKTDVKIQPISLSKRQKQRIRSNKAEKNENELIRKKTLLKSNQMAQTCNFCNHTTITTLLKPNNEYPKSKQKNCIKTVTSKKDKQKTTKEVANKKKTKPDIKSIIDAPKNNTSNSNVYSNAFDVFSLRNQQNMLASVVKETPKLIKNNKKKKDKFAGLCQKAVLASAKIKQDQLKDNKQDRLSLFLKPSFG